MEKLTDLKLSFDKVVIQVIIPGFIGLSTWLLIILKQNNWFHPFLIRHQFATEMIKSNFFFITTLFIFAALSAGIVIQSMGSWIESTLFDALLIYNDSDSEDDNDDEEEDQANATPVEENQQQVTQNEPNPSRSFFQNQKKLWAFIFNRKGINDSEFTETWSSYLMLSFEHEPIAQGFIRQMLFTSQFELSLSISLLFTFIGLGVLRFCYGASWFPFWVFFILIVLIPAIAYDSYKGFWSIKKTREAMIQEFENDNSRYSKLWSKREPANPANGAVNNNPD